MIDLMFTPNMIIVLRSVALLGVLPIILVTAPSIWHVIRGKANIGDPFIAICGLYAWATAGFQVKNLIWPVAPGFYPSSLTGHLLLGLMICAGAASWIYIGKFRRGFATVRLVLENQQKLKGMLSYIRTNPSEAEALAAFLADSSKESPDEL